jgi:hypothetical protein
MEREFGYRTVRFTNADVMSNMEGVLQVLLVALAEQPDRWSRKGKAPPPAPSSEEEGETVALKAPSSSEEGVGGGVAWWARSCRRSAWRGAPLPGPFL